MDIKEQILACLDGINDIDGEANLVELGLNSLRTMRLAAKFKKMGINVTFSELMNNPTLNAWTRLVGGNEKQSNTDSNLKELWNIKYDKEFGLTDVQYAYWAGRQGDQVLGGVGCHAYLEFDGKYLDIDRLKVAWNKLIVYHPMLHAVFTKEGTQKINKVIDSNEIQVIDLTDKSETYCKRVLYEIREKLSHRKLDIESGKNVGLTVSLLPDNRHRIHFDLDLLVADVLSMSIILRDLARLYNGKELNKKVSNWNFEGYLKNINKENKEEARKYWNERIETLPLGPSLPLAKKPKEIVDFRVERKLGRIPFDKWNKIKEKAKAAKTTPSMVLLTAYAMILERWSDTPNFLINIPLFNRNTEIDDIDDVVADFTTLLLLEVHSEDNTTFVGFLEAIRKQFYKDMNYKAYSGVKVQRDMARRHPGLFNIAPVVFACNLETPIIDAGFKNSLGEFTYMISQTPQVWLDYQTYEDEKGLMLAWDVLCELFPEGMIEEMFESFVILLSKLADESWNQQIDVLGEKAKKRRAEALKIGKAKPHYLHTAFFENALKNPTRIALIDGETGATKSYGKIAECALSIAAYLKNRDIVGEAVAITLPKSIEQIVVMYGVLAGGNYYVPVSIGQPFERRNLIHNKVGIHYVITGREIVDTIDWPKDAIVITVEDIYEESKSYRNISVEKYLESLEKEKDENAYIIMTSGSTGEPKGVLISHRAAWNTIQDINTRCNITEADTGFAISAIDFDLSVYDTFGILGAGGKLVVIPENKRKDAFYWIEKVEKYGVTVWNSVPALLEMLLLAKEEQGSGLLPIRIALISGDWIKLDLPDRLAKLSVESRFIAMGGATEASIWSNYCDVKPPIPREWKSIPYGRPLTNQVYRVVDSKGRDCPDYVKGELYIGGAGVAKEYMGDKDLTEKKFTMEEGMKFYHTGDWGRFWRDGIIEFMGRMDSQVKVGGHRIELGEIEAALEKIEGVSTAAVVTMGAERHLVAYIVLDEGKCDNLSKECETIEGDAVGILEQEDIKAPEEKYADELDNLILEAVEKILISIKETDVAECYGEVYGIFKEYIRTHSKKNVEATGRLSAVEEYVNQVVEVIPEILRGEKSAIEVFYVERSNLAPMDAMKTLPFYSEEASRYLTQVGAVLKSGIKTKWKLIERGGTDYRLTLDILKNYEMYIESYSLVVPSPYYVEKAQEMFKDYQMVEVVCAEKIISLQHDYDMLLAFHTMHQAKNVDESIVKWSGNLKKGAFAIFAEMVESSPLQLLTATVLNKGYTYYTDLRREKRSALFNTEEWENSLKKAGYDSVSNMTIDGSDIQNTKVFVGKYKKSVHVMDENKIREAIAKYLPEYMIPKVYITMDKLPITLNGKVDRKYLATYDLVGVGIKKATRKMSASESKLAHILERLLGKSDITVSDNYFELGGDSLTATRLISEVRKLESVEISISEIFNNPSVGAMSAVIEKKHHDKEILERNHRELKLYRQDMKHRYEPFPLTDVQYAYWIGRSTHYSLGQVGTHCYFELDMEDCNYEKLELAFNRLIAEHDMMRAVVLSDGSQRILKGELKYKISVKRLKGENAKEYLAKVREDMSHQLIDTSIWPLFDIRATEYEEKKTRIHISFDNIIFDGFSMFHILGEWKKLYDGIKSKISTYDFSFRDYVFALEDLKKTEWYEQDKEYWLKRVQNFPKAPEFTFMKNPEEVMIPHFARKEAEIARGDWEKIKERSRKIGITPSVFLLTAYSEILSRWSKTLRFALNLTLFNRLPVHKDVERLVGDFTTLTLLEIDREHDTGTNFVERAKRVQKQLMADLEHSYFSGVEMQRKLGNDRKIPVVFTSGLGVDTWDEGNWIGKLVYNISQTPQVWLDHQVVEKDGGLYLFWDYVEDLFEPKMMNEMFEAYRELVEKLAKDEELWRKEAASLVEVPISRERMEANETVGRYPISTLDGAFIESFSKVRENKAVITEDRVYTYVELAKSAVAVMDALVTNNFKAQSVVGIYLEKGFNQIAAVYGTLFAGGVYLPLDVKNPLDRIKKIVENSGMKVILTTTDKVEELTVQDGIALITIDNLEDGDIGRLPRQSVNSLNDLAYIIYTSGSTGTPKGVAITHGGAMNTIIDINERYSVNEKDVAIALSNLNFDLSVYDIFGLLSVGGSIVIPPERHLKNPKYWIAKVKEHGISIWNTVPAFMQMLTAYLKGINSHESYPSLRQIFLSGDWIPVTLPDEVRYYFKNAKVTGLGGATEASIWSNAFEIPESIPTFWKSIPYGKPLTNQKYYVLDRYLNDCPDGVVGQLFIAGYGLAKEYYHDAEKTKEKFIFHENKSERIYATGDMGRYLEDGNIEFLGREDEQVKINGYRVELGEIENALRKVTGAKEVAAVVVTDKENTYTAGFIVGKKSEYNEAAIRQGLKEILPKYMVPEVIGYLMNMELSGNGKINRKALAKQAEKLVKTTTVEKNKKSVKPISYTEKRMIEIWKNVLENDEISVEDHFFESGGNSLQAIYLVNTVNTEFSCDLGIDKLFDYPTIRQLAGYLDEMN